ncbi:MAG: hypothetical protein WC346_04440 [Methanogenium sp.]|jgi:hypothetical protein
MKSKTLKEVENLYGAYISNVNSIINPIGKKRIIEQINALKEYLENPNIPIDDRIISSSGEKRRIFRWIKGELV